MGLRWVRSLHYASLPTQLRFLIHARRLSQAGAWSHSVIARCAGVERATFAACYGSAARVATTQARAPGARGRTSPAGRALPPRSRAAIVARYWALSPGTPGIKVTRTVPGKTTSPANTPVAAEIVNVAGPLLPQITPYSGRESMCLPDRRRVGRRGSLSRGSSIHYRDRSRLRVKSNVVDTCP
jgi:hypothetical protein